MCIIKLSVFLACIIFMFISLYIKIYIYIYIYTYMYIYVYMHTYIEIYTHVCTFAYLLYKWMQRAGLWPHPPPPESLVSLNSFPEKGGS